MLLYRIAHCKHIRDMNGTGGLYASGRWHALGTRILYFSEHLSLAKLEVLANVNFLPVNMCLLTIEVDDDISIEEIDTKELPVGWDTYPYLDELRKFTTKWLHLSKSAMLKVPSAQARREFNCLINPQHPDTNKISIKAVEKIKFDERLKLQND